MKVVVLSLVVSAFVAVQGQMPQRVNDPRMEYQVGFRPFGSDLPCYALINETLSKNGDDVIIERILMNIDEPGNSFNSNANTNRVDNIATRICGQMQNTVGYLRNTCQQNTNNIDSTAQAKLRALGALREYLCLNNALNLKEMISSNGGQCVRRIRDSAEANCNLPMQPSGNFNSGSFNSGTFNSGGSSNGQGSTAGNSFNSGRMGPRSLTSMIIMAPNYNSDTCRTINDAANCFTDKYNRAVEICYPQFTMHMSKIISSLVQNACGGSTGPFPGNNNNFNNNWNNNNNNQNPSTVNANSNNFPPNNNNNNDFSTSSNNFGSGSNNFPQTADSGFRTTTWAPRPVWMTSSRRPGNSATVQTISAMLLSVAVLPCLLI